MQNVKRDEHQFEPSGGQNFDNVKMSQRCCKKHLFHLRYLFTYYIVKHMDASVLKSLFFFFCIFHSVTLQQQQMVQVVSLFQSSERREHSSEPRILGLLSRKLGINSLCGVLFSGTHPSYWAAFEGTFLRLKLDQFTATFCRVCFAESRQNLKKKVHKYFSGNNVFLYANIYLKQNKIYLLKYSTSRSISSISVGSTSLGRNTSSRKDKEWWKHDWRLTDSKEDVTN